MFDQPLLSESIWNDRIYSKGWRTAKGGTLRVEEPATGRVLTRVGLANAADVADAAEIAAEAQVAWAARPATERAAILYRAARILAGQGKETLEWMMRESGSIEAKSQIELEHGAGFVEHAAAMASEGQGIALPSTPGRLSLAMRVPHGVVGVISPFNFPLVLSIRAVAPALATGNAVILKPDPRTPITGGLLIARVFEEAGLPEGLLHVLPGGVEAGEAMCTVPNIHMITFTGSTAVGRRIGALAGGHLKKVSLELGGKNALIILDDADLDAAASNAAWGAWMHQGQICMTTGRILAQKAIAEALIERLVSKATHLPVGDPMSRQVALGPLISQSQRDRVHSLVQGSVAAGAKLAAGGTFEGLFYKPTVLTGVWPGMPIFDSETFGPVAAITTFETEDEAVKLAHMGEAGLVGAVIGSYGRAMTLGERLNVGHLHINDQTVLAEPGAPFGGRRASGNGSRISGPANWDEFTTWKWMTAKAQATPYPF